MQGRLNQEDEPVIPPDEKNVEMHSIGKRWWVHTTHHSARSNHWEGVGGQDFALAVLVEEKSNFTESENGCTL